MKFAKRMHAEALEISHREDADIEQMNHADVPFVPYKQLKKRIKRLSQSTSHGTYPYDNGAAAEAVDAAAGGGGWYAEPLDQGQSDNDQCRPPHEDTGLEQGRGYGDDERAESDAFLVELDQVCEELDAWFIKLAQVSDSCFGLSIARLPSTETTSTLSRIAVCADALNLRGNEIPRATTLCRSPSLSIPFYYSLPLSTALCHSLQPELTYEPPSSDARQARGIIPELLWRHRQLARRVRQRETYDRTAEA